jgi:Flp pilus assembly protein TadD
VFGGGTAAGKRMSMTRADRLRIDLAVMLVLAVAVAAIYLQTAWFEFVNWDDDQYVFRNTRVRQGLSWASVAWALVAVEASNWHPLTWLSYLLDSSLFGAWAGGYHLTSVAWHLAASVLVYLLLRRLTDETWRPALVAMLFAVHPLHVESVAWISERKDVLCAVFGLLAMHAYVSYARAPSTGRYLLVMAAFACSLMSKQMLVTLPAVLLLLDWWPLRRLAWTNWRQRVLEKLPLLALAAGAAVLTVLAQSGGGSMRSLEQLPLLARLTNATSSYGIYLQKHLWPSELSFFQVMRPPSLVFAGLVFLVIAAVIAVAWRMRERLPAMLVGWLWFLGTLVPVIGIVQVGDQGWASRYSYFPSIGLFLMLAWLLPVPDFTAARRQASLLVAGAVLVVTALSVRAFIETGYWRNSDSLFVRAIALDPGNFVGHTLLASMYAGRGARQQAEYHALEAERTSGGPGGATGIALVALSRVLMEVGRFEGAWGALERARKILPKSAVVYYNLGTLELMRGVPLASLPHFDHAVGLFPEYSEAYNNRGVALARLGRLDEAVAAHRRAVETDSYNYQAHFNLGVALATAGRPAEALAAFEASAALVPLDIRPKLKVAALLKATGRQAEARAVYQAILAIEPANATARSELSR